MKHLILACGSGVATSTAVANKISELLDKNGYKGQYQITQCSIQDAKSKCANADMLIATTVAPADLPCPYVNGVPFLIGMGTEAAEKQILDLMAQ